jgi:trehalose 6-phosphate phosphatase
VSGDDGTQIAELPDALEADGELARELHGRRPAVFLDYDGVLTPIVDRPEDAKMSDGMRDTVRELAGRCSVCVVSGRDREVVQQLMGVDDLVVAGSHGFDIWDPGSGTLEHEASQGFEELLEGVTARVKEEAGRFDGTAVEEKKASVAIHYRQVPSEHHEEIGRFVEAILGDHPDELKVTPGKMVYELQPKLDWHKGRAVLHLIDVLGLDSEDVAPVYLGDDVTDEDAFRALAGGRGVGIFVGDAEDPEVAGRTTAARFVLHSVDDVERFLGGLAR